ncbi:MAG: cyclic nucleotide-binding domain-containing protein [Deltaproteobacteria bacterium]|nr:cyclic nucleotide-binding domain-containing protein [Deltaproteobacteria bacterium]
MPSPVAGTPDPGPSGLRFLADALLVRPGEERRTLLLFLHLFLASAVFVMGRTVRDTLFLSRYSLSALPWMFVGYGVASALTAVIYARAADRLARDRMIVVWCGLGVASYLGVWALARAQASFIYPVFYVWAEVFANLLISQFWTLANDLHDARSARRLFGTIGAARVLGVIVVGLGTGAIVRVLGTAQLLFVLAGLMLLIGALALRLGREPRVTQAPSRPRGTSRRKPPSILRDGYVVALSLMILFAFAALTIGDFQFKAIARATYREDDLARFFSFFYAGTGIVSFLFQLFATPRLLARFGVALGMSVMPAVFGAASGVLLGLPTLVVATVMKFADNGFQYTIHETTMQALYVPFPAGQKVRTRALLDAVVKPVAYGLGGVALILLARPLGTVKLSWVAVGLVLGWVALIPVVRRRYLTTLENTLRAGALAHLDEEPVLDASRRKALLGALNAADARVALAAADELGATAETEVRAALLERLTHPEPAVRIAVLLRLTPLAAGGRAPELALGVGRALADPVAEVRAAAALAQAELGRDDAVEQLAPLFDDPSQTVRVSVLRGLLSFGGFEGALAAGTRVAGLLASSAVEDRIAGARALGGVGPSAGRRVGLLLDDPDLRVRRAALEAAREIGDARLVPRLVSALRDRPTRTLAASALGGAGPAAVKPLCELLADVREERGIRLVLPRILRAIGGPESYVALRAQTDDADPHIRLRVFSGLSRLREKLARPPEPLPQVRTWIEREVVWVYELVSGYERARELLGTPLFDEEVGMVALRGARRVLRILELRYAPGPLRLVRERVEDPLRRANALEVLDTNLEASLRPLVMTFFDDVRVTEKMSRSGVGKTPDPDAFLERLFGAANPYLVFVALDALSRHGHGTAGARALGAVAHADPLVREGALLGLVRLRPEGTSEALDRLARDGDPVVQSLAGRARERLARPFDGEEPMYSTVEKLLILRAAPLFGRLRNEDLVPLARVAEVETIGAGEEIFEEGDLGNVLYVVARGKVAITRAGGLLAELGPGETFGEMSVLDAEPRSAGARAVEATELLCIGSEEFYEVLHEQVEIAEGVIRMLSRRLREANQRLEEAANGSGRTGAREL